MSRRVRWTARAAIQLEDAATYLERERRGTGLPLVDQVEAILNIASARPRTFPRVPDVPGNEVRRGLVRRYGYWVIYEIRPGEIVVLSVWHGSREPRGWRRT